MYFHAPRDIYGSTCFRMFMDELGGVKPVSRHLGVSERTVYHWLSTGRAPRSAVLALYWETQYGRSHIFTDQVNEIRSLYRRVCLLHEQYQRAKDIVTGLRALQAGSANEPLFEELPDFGDPIPPTVGHDSPVGAGKQEGRTSAASIGPSKRARAATAAFERTRAAAGA